MKIEDVLKDWKSYEKFVCGFYSGADKVIPKHNVIITDKEGSPRQIDTLLTVEFGPLAFSVVVECKSGKSPVKRQMIDALVMTRDRVSANKAMLFANGRFQSGAENTAKSNGVELFHVRTPAPGEWWPDVSRKAIIQVWSLQLQNKLVLPWSEVGIGTPNGVEWPKGIHAPKVSFASPRTKTPLLDRGGYLEDAIEDSVRAQIANSVSPQIGLLRKGEDCVGHFSIRCDVKFVNPIHIQERKDPPVFLLVPRLSVVAAVRVEQRTLEWKGADELESAFIVEEVTTKRRFQVGRATEHSSWMWIPSDFRPTGGDLTAKQRLVIVVKDFFRPEIFADPWTTFNTVNFYETHEIPPSQTLSAVLNILSSSPASPSP